MSNNTLWWLVKPSHALLLLLTAGLMLRHTRAGRWLGATAGVALLLAAFSPLGHWLMHPLENRFDTPPTDTAPPYGIIVLAGAEQPRLHQAHGVPHFNGFADRLTTFVLLANRHPDARLIHSGLGSVSGVEHHTQSSTAESFLSVALTGRQITYENRSQNTQQAGIEVSALLTAQQRSREWWLVTSAFHMPRAIASFRARGINVIAWPTDYSSAGGWLPPDAAGNLNRLDWATHEWLGLLYYRLRGATNELFPAPGDASRADRNRSTANGVP
jgi:uncharacterized SAM-binding protein YcdF (DUF218 family)